MHECQLGRNIVIKPLVKMRSLRFHKERYEFQCDRSDNQQDMTKKVPRSRVSSGSQVFFSLPHHREMSHDHNHKKRDRF